MKKNLSLLLAVWAAFLAACGQSDGGAGTVPLDLETGGTVSEAEEAVNKPLPKENLPLDEETAASHILVAYFSWAENAIFLEEAGEVEALASPSVVVPGNVQQLAGWVQEETGGDLFSIQVTDPYPSDWDACLERANEERGSGARPALRGDVENLDSYDTVFLGYPNWWYGVPMALLSFLEQNDLSGKEVYLFCSHGTGGLANSVEQIAEALPEAVISDNIFDCYEEEAASSEAAIRSWVNSLGDFRQKEADGGTPAAEQRQIAVQFGGNTIVYALNEGSAADSLYGMLPLTTQVEDYSTNEKIFYPKEGLDTSNSPLAQAGAGTLAYYEPWGDVVFFYGDYRENPGLFQLGQAVSGGELIAQMSGTITIEAMESQQ